ncbi:MAG: DNA-binding transcriptional regulator GbsR (MarR family) [Kiritimatiellia bacterium]
MDKLQEAKWEMIEAGGRTAQSFGLNRLLGQIYMFLYLRRDSASLDDILEALGVSKASASIACRQLQALGALRRVWKKGDRKDYYEAETDLRSLLNNGILREVNKKLDSAQVQIDRCREILKSEGETAPSEELTHFTEQLNEAERYKKRISGLLNNPLVQKLL